MFIIHLLQSAGVVPPAPTNKGTGSADYRPSYSDGTREWGDGNVFSATKKPEPEVTPVVIHAPVKPVQKKAEPIAEVKIEAPPVAPEPTVYELAARLPNVNFLTLDEAIEVARQAKEQALGEQVEALLAANFSIDVQQMIHDAMVLAVSNMKVNRTEELKRKRIKNALALIFK